MDKLYRNEFKETKSLVLGFPGFAHSSENTRIDNHLKVLSSYGIVGVRLNYPGILLKEDGKLIECNFNLADYLDHVQRTFNAFSQGMEKIGIIDSSAGSCISGHWLAKNPAFNPACKFSVSPLSGWQNYGSPEIRQAVEKSGKDIDISSKEDKSNGIRRTIKHDSLEEMMGTNAIGAIRSSQRQTYPVFTCLGVYDDKVSVSSMREYHHTTALSGESFLLELQEPHEIPESRYLEAMVSFFTKHLL